MPLSDPVVEPLRSFIHRLEDASAGAPKPEEALRTMAADLQRLSAAVRWDECHYRQALGSEELVYEIARARHSTWSPTAPGYRALLTSILLGQ
jgi:hypothetical protein